MRTKEGQKRHDEGVSCYTSQLGELGWRLIYADLPGHAKPPQIGAYIPDLYAKTGLKEIVIEIETRDSINTAHAIFQKNTFERWAKQSPNREFLVFEV